MSGLHIIKKFSHKQRVPCFKCRVTVSYVCFSCAVSCHSGLVDDRFIQAVACHGAVGVDVAVAVWGLWLDCFLHNVFCISIKYLMTAVCCEIIYI